MPGHRLNLSPTLKKTAQLSEEVALIALDEFAVQSVPYTHYAWAQKNTKPKIMSDERHRQKLNGFLTVDVQRGTTRVDFNELKVPLNRPS